MPAGQRPAAPAAPASPAPARPAPRRPASPATGVGEWAARRQADVLLYVGAFLLVISALIFVSSQDQALAGWWRVVILAVYTAAFMVAGWLLQRWPSVREAGPAFLAIGALMSPLNFLLLYEEVLSDREVAGALVWFVASLYSAAFYGLLFAGGAGRLYAIPAGLAMLSAWGSLAVTAGIPLEWGGAWWMAFALVGADALSAARRWTQAATATVAVLASLATLYAIAVAIFADAHEWQLPVTLGLLLMTVGVAGASRRGPGAAIGVAVLAVLASIAALWAAGAEVEWYSFPPLVVGALLLAGRPGWVRSSPELGFGALLLATGAAAAPFLLAGAHLDGDSSIAVAAFAGSAALFAAAGWLNTSEGVAAWAEAGTGPTTRLRPTPVAERVVYGWLAFIAALAAIGFAQRAQGLSPPDTGWVLAVIATGCSGALLLRGRERPALLWALLPPLLLAVGASLHPIEEHVGHDAVLLALAAAHVLVAFAVLRRWSLAVVGVALAMLASAVLWEVQAWPWWVLAAAYAAGGVALFGLVTPLRSYDQPRAAEGETFWAARALSWGPIVVAAGVALAALAERLDAPAVEMVETVEYRALVLIVLAFAPLVAIEAWRLREWAPAVVPCAVVLGVAAALWPVFAWPAWTLAIAYSVAGAATFAALTQWRRPGTSTSEVAVQGISWSGLALGPLTAMWALGARLEGLDAEPATLVEFRALALLFLPLAAAVAFEGYRLGVRWALVPASALVMVALELAVATFEPGNVQAHTLPAAVHLALVGLTMRPAERLSNDLGWHEVLQVVGAGLLVLPQAEQGFEPGGARWGLVLLIEGVALLAVALALNTRWLAVSAVVTLSGVALRFLWVNRETDVVPYWAMLAVAGFLLLAVGLTVLLQREWWDRSRARLLHRWRQDPVLHARTADEVPVAALLTSLAPVLAIIAITAGE